MVCAVRRRDHIVACQDIANRHRDSFLSECHMEEPGKIAGAKALFDLFLEAADQKHVPEESEERLVREPRGLLDVRHLARHRTRMPSTVTTRQPRPCPERPLLASSVMGPTRIAAVQLSRRLDLLCASLPRGWTQLSVQLLLADLDDARRASTVLGPLSPGRTG